MSQAGVASNITTNPAIATSYVTNSGTAIPSGNVLQVLGGTNITTAASGNVITITNTGAGGSGITTIDGNSGSITGTTVNILGLGSIVTSGSVATMDVQLTGMTSHAVLVGGGNNLITPLALGTNGQVLIGSTGANPVFNTITSNAGTITITGGAGTLNLDVTGGSAVTEHLTGNSGGQLNPDGSNNFNILGTGSITVAGAGSTLTAQLTGLTAHNVVLGEGTATVGLVAPSATSGVPLVSNGAAADPIFGTAVVAGGGTGAVTLSGILTGFGTSPIQGTPVSLYSVLTGGASNTPNSVAPSATAGIPLISEGSSAQPQFGTAVVAGGGIGDTSFTAYAVICGGTTSTGALQSIASVGTSGQVLTSNGAGALPTFQNAGSAIMETLSDDTGTTITPSSNNIQLVGHINEQGATKFSTVVAGTHLANINPMSSARWIVDPLGFNGTHTTIASALSSATSGDTIFLLPGTYTENPTLVAGVNLAANICDALTPNVTILGKCTFTGSGTVALSGIQLKTNSDYCLAVTGSSASIVELTNCYINCSNNTGINFSSSNSGAEIHLRYTNGDVGTTGITYWSHSSAGIIRGFYGYLTNTGLSTTLSNNSAGKVQLEYVDINVGISTSLTGTIAAYHCQLYGSSANVTAVTTAGTGGALCNLCDLNGGSSSAASFGAGTSSNLYNCTIASSNTDAITGAGSLAYSGLSFTSSSSLINTTTQNGGVLPGGRFQAPSAGYIGERISSGYISPTSISNNSATTLASIALTPGIWDISTNALAQGSVANIAAFVTGISATTNSLVGINSGDNAFQNNPGTAQIIISGCVPSYRVVITANTTYYLVNLAIFAAGTCQHSGRISAVRAG